MSIYIYPQGGSAVLHFIATATMTSLYIKLLKLQVFLGINGRKGMHTSTHTVQTYDNLRWLISRKLKETRCLLVLFPVYIYNSIGEEAGGVVLATSENFSSCPSLFLFTSYSLPKKREVETTFFGSMLAILGNFTLHLVSHG